MATSSVCTASSVKKYAGDTDERIGGGGGGGTREEKKAEDTSSFLHTRHRPRR